MAATARESNDQSLIDACRKLWDNVTTKRMYITGGIGSCGIGERFSFDYDLPNEEAYAETCAAIALCFFAEQMLLLDADAKYADIFERALYNSVISGISRDGKQFYYDNILASKPPRWKYNNQKSPRRQDWFGCACCPPNIARIIASLNYYLNSTADNTLFIHQYANSDIAVKLGGTQFKLTEKTSYPWDGDITINVKPERDGADAVIAFRIPGWCQNASATVNGTAIDITAITTKGYAYISRKWNAGDTLKILLEMPVMQIYAHPSVRQDQGKVALQRGPIVFCLEECDNGADLNAIKLPPVSQLEVVKAPDALGDIPAISGLALRNSTKGWDNTLYAPKRPEYDVVKITAIPYFMWANREPGEMIIWINQ